uniref:C-type lectin domain-containing protein n=1 Tax=Sparus aurata TaxID=8175 RepID=A0A671VC74_SPAAU
SERRDSIFNKDMKNVSQNCLSLLCSLNRQSVFVHSGEMLPPTCWSVNLKVVQFSHIAPLNKELLMMRLNVFLSVPLYMSFSAHSQCHQGWREFEGKCYYFSTDAKSWNDANAFCMTQRSSLMSIQDQWVGTQLNSDIYWIGLTDHVVEGVWEWSDGKPFIEYLS